jgi:5-methylcytosine-specific restriction endonuclease McrA
MKEVLRETVRQRAGFRCEYCLLPAKYSILDFEIDHIIPEKHGGLPEQDNLALACCYCNRFKGPNLSGIDPLTGAIIRLFNPRRDKWAEHFFWSDSKLGGKSPIARVTISVLEMNLPGHRRLRTALAAEGVFPYV